MIWLLLLGGMLLLTFAGVWFLIRKTVKFSCFQKIKKKRKRYLLSGLIWLMVLILLTLWSGIWNALICYLHLILFWLLFELVFWFIKKVRKKEFQRYYAGTVSILFTVCYLLTGLYTAYHVVPTQYQIQPVHSTDEKIRIVGFSDSHVGTTFHADKFREYVDKMNAEQPDLVVIAGDFVDDSTTCEDMIGCCEALSKLNAKYGVYFAFGNHDAGYFGREHRGYGKEELIENLEKNNVRVLEDEVVSLTDKVYLCGRADASRRDRAAVKSLLEPVPSDAVTIVLDHQPNDYEAENAAGADLVISGHTHGGQLFPFNQAGEWLRLNDSTYGYSKRGNSNFIVSSGISDWEIKFKTGCISEYFVIDVAS